MRGRWGFAGPWSVIWRCVMVVVQRLTLMEGCRLRAAPHLGGAYSTMAVDVVARFQVRTFRCLEIINSHFHISMSWQRCACAAFNFSSSPARCRDR